jgi:hypothetical protein
LKQQPLVRPNVLDAYRQSVRVLKKAKVPYRATGGIALNLHGAGRPAKDVDLIVLPFGAWGGRG